MQTLNISESQLTSLVPCLLITSPSGEQWVHQLEPDSSVIIGNSAGCGLRLEGNDIDSMHCMLSIEGGDAWMRPWMETSLTLLNGEPLNDLTQLNTGDCATVGGYQLAALIDDSVSTSFVSKLIGDGVKVCEEAKADAAKTESENCDVSTASDQMESIQIVDTAMQSPDDECVTDIDSGDKRDESNTTDSSEAVEIEAAESRLTELIDQIGRLETIVEDHEQNPGPQSPVEEYSSFEVEENEIELLREEIMFLQTELAERDARISELDCGEAASVSNVDVDDSEQVNRLVKRLEDLLDELESSDKRIRALEELLKANDELNQAEQEERNQLESWVNNIESLVAQRESEWMAEKDRLLSSFGELKEKNKKTEDMLLKIQSGGATAAETNLVAEFRSENDKLRQRVSDLESKCESMKREMQQLDVDADEFRSAEEIEKQMKEMQLEVSRERSEMARQKAEVARIRNELEQQINVAKSTEPTSDADQRLHAIRQHLKEIHDVEKTEKKERSLGGRISRLFQRLEKR